MSCRAGERICPRVECRLPALRQLYEEVCKPYSKLQEESICLH